MFNVIYYNTGAYFRASNNMVKYCDTGEYGVYYI